MVDITGLSGQVTTLESNFANLTQQMLTKISIETLNAYQAVVNQSVNSFDGTLVNILEKVNTLQQLYSALVYTQATRYTLQTGTDYAYGINLTGILETTGNYTFTQTGAKNVVITFTGDRLVTLPNTTGVVGTLFSVKKTFTGFNAITITGFSAGQLIDGQFTKVITGSRDSALLRAGLTGWYLY